MEQQRNQIIMEYHYHFNIFNQVIDFQLQKLNNRFIAHAMYLLTLNFAVDPKEQYKSFIFTLLHKSIILLILL